MDSAVVVSFSSRPIAFQEQIESGVTQLGGRRKRCFNRVRSPSFSSLCHLSRWASGHTDLSLKDRIGHRERPTADAATATTTIPARLLPAEAPSTT